MKVALPLFDDENGCFMTHFPFQFGGPRLFLQKWWVAALVAAVLPTGSWVEGGALANSAIGGGAIKVESTKFGAKPAAEQAEVNRPLLQLPKLDVVVTIGPLRGITSRIVPEGSRIEQLIPSGVSEHGYEIPPGKLRLLIKTDLVVRIGEVLEPQVEKALAANPRPERGVVTMLPDTGLGHSHGGTGAVSKSESGKIGSAKPHAHDHGPGETCDEHGGSDPHVWLDPVLMERFAVQIGAATTAALIARTPDVTRHAEIDKAISQRVAAVTLEIRGVDAEYKAVLAGKAHRTIVVTHDAWGHLAGRYGLKTVALKGLSATEPTMAALKLAAETVKEEMLTTVFLEPQLSRAAGKRIAEATGVKTAMLDPLGGGDWFAMMRGNLRAIAASLPDAATLLKPAVVPAAEPETEQK